MKKYVAILSNKNRARFSDELLDQHVSYLKAQERLGNMVLCGPFADNESAIQILMSDSIDKAYETVASDPFISEGYYENVEVKELIEANASNNWLVSDPQTNSNRADSKT